MKKKIAIIGATGMLGSRVYAELNLKFDLILFYRDKQMLKALNKKHGGISNHEVFNLDLEKMFKEYSSSQDNFKSLVLTNKILSKLVKCDVVINCAGLLKDETNKFPALALFINGVFPNILSQRLGEKLVHITTDCVFNGASGAPYKESSPKIPSDLYGLSKSIGEPEESLVLRTSFIGPELKGSNSFFEWVISSRNKKIYGYTNHVWNGLTTNELSKVLLKIVTNRSKYPKKGIYHIFSTSITKHDMIATINKQFKLGIIIVKKKSNPIDRRLGTIYPFNKQLKLPDFDTMVAQIYQ